MEDDFTHQLILKNDNDNDFLFVMACLVNVCEHARDQAEQCVIIAHNKDECQIKRGDITKMIELHGLLDDLGIKTEIREYESSLHK
jgi:ATP-dependent Clp protease adaptor protein ClpS